MISLERLMTKVDKFVWGKDNDENQEAEPFKEDNEWLAKVTKEL